MGHNATGFGWNFDNTYAQLPDVFFERVKPTAVSSPKIVLFNNELACALELNSKEFVDRGSDFLSGNAIFQGSEPIAQAYAGHQFAHFTMLGDGRANLLGEHITSKGDRYDIHLKGSGLTRFSRGGDGRAALGPMLREYLISEAMAALRISTTRSLAVVTTGENVVREKTSPGAILTRIASSHIRVGTFEYASTLNDHENLRQLVDYTLRRHYPDLASQSEPYVAFLRAVIERQASLIAQWMLVGFIHGVMNTDNMTLSGETIDYGPCAFMDNYSLATVFSSIDRRGRYAFGQQPGIAQWNLARFAETLLPFLAEDEKVSVTKAEEALDTFSGHLQRYWLAGMRGKLGIVTASDEDMKFITSFLEMLEKHRADYTNTFRALSLGTKLDEPLFKDAQFLEWHKAWVLKKPDFELMRAKNPAVIPRNHLVEKALTAAVERGDYSVLEKFLSVVREPFVEPKDIEYTEPAIGGEGYRTFCGT